MDALSDTAEQNNPGCHSGGMEAPGPCCQCVNIPGYLHQQLHSFQCGITQPICPSFLCAPRKGSNLDWTGVERKGCVTGDIKLADCSQFHRSAEGKLLREMERKHASVNKSEDLKSNQMGMHGGVYLYINQLCKVESIFWGISTRLKILHLWLLTINSKKKEQRTSSYIFTRMLNQTSKAGCHNFSGVCPIFGLHLFQKSALLGNSRHVPLNQENCKHKRELAINPDQQLTCLALLNLHKGFLDFCIQNFMFCLHHD